jgi:hypothetical protein
VPPHPAAAESPRLLLSLTQNGTTLSTLLETDETEDIKGPLIVDGRPLDAAPHHSAPINSTQP